MGLLTFSLNVTLDGCVDHQEGIADDETHAFFTRLMDEGGAMLWGRVTYEMMESYWPAVARGDVEAPPAVRDWAVKLEMKPSTSRRRREQTSHGPTATTSLATCARACKSSRTRPRPAYSSVAASSRPSWTGWISSTSTSFLFTPGSLATVRPCTRAGWPARDGSSWSRRNRSVTARSPCTTGACAASHRWRQSAA